MPSEHAVRVIRRSSEHLANLADELLDISRIESGALRLNHDKVRLGDFLDQIVDMFRLQAMSKGIEFRYERAARLPAYVNTDEKRLRQILINLLSNAIKYTEAGFASLRVLYRDPIAEFEIADSGFGVPTEDLDRIFEPFERGKLASRHALPGAGLGLTITKLLTQVMGGEISLRSHVGEGSVFRVRLLLSEAFQSIDHRPAPRRARGYFGPRVRILIADDNSAHLDLVQDVLRPLGFTLFAACDGASAVKLAEEVRPDVAMLDITMPGLNGWEAAAALRERYGRAIKIVMISANAHDHREGGGPHDAFLVKPLDIQQMLDRLQTLTGVDWIEDALAEEPAILPACGDLPKAAAAHFRELKQLGRIGYISGIEAKLREIESEDPAYAAAAAELRALVRSFQLKRYMETLDKRMEILSAPAES